MSDRDLDHRGARNGDDGDEGDIREDDDDLIRNVSSEQRAQGRWNAGAIPMERSARFGESVRRLLQVLGRERSRLTLVAVCAVTSVVLNVIGPRLLGRATDLIIRGIGSPDGIDFGALHGTLLMALVLYLASAALQVASAWMVTGLVQRTMFRLRAQAEAKVHVLPLEYLDRQARGDLLSRVTNDLDNLSQSLQQTLSQMLTSVLLLVGVTIMMFTISWVLTLIALITVPLSIYGMRKVASRARPHYLAQWSTTGALNAQIEEAFTGHAIVKAFGRQADVEARFQQTNAGLYQSAFSAQFMSSLMQPLTMFLGNVQYVLVAVVGGLRVSSGAITVGDVQAFIQYSRNFSMPLTQLASMMNVFQSGIASLERVLELLDTDEQSPDPPMTVPATQSSGRVTFDDVTFSYDPDIRLIEHLSFVADPGQTVAIVGPTGAGKTTLVNLLMRFYELDGGRITLDGRDIAAMHRRELRAQMGMVLQDTWLFGGTIRENIAYGRPGATDEEIFAAARAAYVDRFAKSLPDGYDSLINEEGDNISAGEKQLMTIARAFLAQPAILILDEATSSVDTRTEVQIQEAMNALRANRTSFVIAHRLSTIRGADVILVMEHGQIVEQGSHTELLARGDAYARLYNSQFAGAVAAIA